MRMSPKVVLVVMGENEVEEKGKERKGVDRRN